MKPDRCLMCGLGGFALAACVLKISLMLWDPQVRYYLRDSESYLGAALTDWIPTDRSWVYGRMIRWTAGLAGDISVLLWVQTAFGAMVAMFAWWLVHHALGLPRKVAWAIGLLVVLDPEQLFYERMMMAEAASLAALVAMFGCGVGYVRSGRMAWLPGGAAAGILAVSLRVSLLPIVLGFAVLPVLTRWACVRKGDGWRRPLCALVASMVLAVAAHQAYLANQQRLLPDWPKGYIAYAGYFRLGLVLPLVRDEDFRAAGLPPDFLSHVSADWRDPRQRHWQLWKPDGVTRQLSSVLGPVRGDEAALAISSNALHRDATGLLRLSVGTLSDYFDPAMVRERLIDDAGTRELSGAMLETLARNFRVDASRAHIVDTPVARYFVGTAWWDIFCLFALGPVALVLVMLAWRRRHAVGLLLGLTAGGLAASIMLFSHIISIRYLHPLPFFFWLSLCGICAMSWRGRGFPDGFGTKTAGSRGSLNDASAIFGK